jgi:hypothetical protein
MEVGRLLKIVGFQSVNDFFDDDVKPTEMWNIDETKPS